MTAGRPVPNASPLTRPFWDACTERRLIVQRCRGCGTHVFIPQEFCPTCRASDLDWVESRGSGTVVTYTTVGRPQTPAFDAPYVVAVVELDEGFEMLTNIVGDDPTAVRIGGAVTVEFVDVADGVTLPCFTVDPVADR